MGNFILNQGKNISFNGNVKFWEDLAFILVSLVFYNGAIIPCHKKYFSIIIRRGNEDINLLLASCIGMSRTKCMFIVPIYV